MAKNETTGEDLTPLGVLLVYCLFPLFLIRAFPKTSAVVLTIAGLAYLFKTEAPQTPVPPGQKVAESRNATAPNAAPGNVPVLSTSENDLGIKNRGHTPLPEPVAKMQQAPRSGQAEASPEVLDFGEKLDRGYLVRLRAAGLGSGDSDERRLREYFTLKSFGEVLYSKLTGKPGRRALVNGSVDRGNAALQRGDVETAIKEFSIAIRSDPRNPMWYVNRGIARTMSGDYPNALEDLNQTLKINPSSSGDYALRGILKRQAGNLEGAIADYSQAIGLNPDFTVAYLNRAMACHQLERFREAIADYERVLQLFPGHPRATSLLAKARVREQ